LGTLVAPFFAASSSSAVPLEALVLESLVLETLVAPFFAASSSSAVPLEALVVETMVLEALVVVASTSSRYRGTSPGTGGEFKFS